MCFLERRSSSNGGSPSPADTKVMNIAQTAREMESGMGSGEDDGYDGGEDDDGGDDDGSDSDSSYDGYDDGTNRANRPPNLGRGNY